MRLKVFSIALFVLFVSCGALAGTQVHLRYAEFDPLIGPPNVPSDLRATEEPGQTAYYIVQFDGPIEQAMKSEIICLGAELLDYLPDFALIARMTPETAARVARVPRVRWIGPYHPAYKMSPEMRNEGSSERLEATILLFPDESTAEVARELALSGASVHASKDGHNPYVEATLPLQAVAAISRQRGVAWIEPRVERKLCNDVARTIMDVNPAWTGIGIYGSGETVVVCDTGLDTGNLDTISADFAGRVFKTYAFGRKNKWSDPEGHGTHVAGSVLGSGALSGSNPASHNYATSFAGVAPEAQLILQAIAGASGMLTGLPPNLNDLFQPTYGDGARIHTNSWGAATYGTYNTDSRNTDMFIWNNKDFTVLFSAGNEGIDSNSDGVIDSDSIGAPGTAKNCITVGASENYRVSGGAQSTYGAYWPSDFPADPVHSDQVSDDSMGVVAFSSRGPTDDNRIKPDILAPGTNVVSCRSHANGADPLWGVYNNDYVYCGGTSMSTPLVAGACAIVRQYYRTQRSHLPTAALVKATLINGATEMNPGQYGSGGTREIPSSRPNNVEGWGRLDLAYSVMPASPRAVEYVDNTTGLNTGGSTTYTYSLLSDSRPLRVTLVWTDYPASTSASIDLVNDLDLTVQPPSGPVLRGNGTADRRNNVEGVDIASPATGSYTITVSAYNVPNGPQPFALVVSGVLGEPTPLPTAVMDLPTNGTALSGAVGVTGTASGASFLNYTLEYGAGGSPSSWTQMGGAHSSPVTDGLLGTWDTAALANGTFTLRLTAHNTSGTSTDTVTVSVLRATIASARENSDGMQVTVTAQVVSGAPSQFGQSMWIQQADRSSGIRVIGTALPVLSIGDIVTVEGMISTSDGERFIANPAVTWTGSAIAPRPLGLPGRSVGGNLLIPTERGLGNVGLLVKLWGDVTAVGPDYFYVDDGSNLDDGSGNLGIKVHTRTLTMPSVGQCAVVTGICSTEINGPAVRRVIRPRTQADLIYL